MLALRRRSIPYFSSPNLVPVILIVISYSLARTYQFLLVRCYQPQSQIVSHTPDEGVQALRGSMLRRRCHCSIWAQGLSRAIASWLAFVAADNIPGSPQHCQLQASRKARANHFLGKTGILF